MSGDHMQRLRLGELLVEAGALGRDQLAAALSEQRTWGEPLGRTLVHMGLVSEELLVRALSKQLGLPSCDPASMELAPGVPGFVGVDVCEEYGVLPVSGDATRREVWVATADPTNQLVLARLGDRIGYRVLPVVAAPSRIEAAIRRHYYGEAVAAAPEPVAEQAAAPVEAQSGEKLEQLVAAQLRALRVLVEMLAERGIIDRSEYQTRLRGG